MQTIVPIDRLGNCEVRDEEGKQTGTATARPSASCPGYMTVIVYGAHSVALRVPTDWFKAAGYTDEERTQIEELITELAR